MKVTSHTLPTPGMIGGLAADPERGCLWLGMAGDSRMLWRYDVATREFTPEPLGGLADGYSYIHRSIVVDGERVFVGLTWIMGIRPGGRAPSPFSPSGFGKMLGVLSWLGSVLARCRVLEREDEGRWKIVRDGPYMSMDLATSRGKLFRLSPKGILEVSYSGEVNVAPSPGGFVHEVSMGPGGELLVSDANGELSLQKGDRRHILGSLKDAGTGLVHDPRRATPGVDGVCAVGDRYLIGATRNKARPFVVDHPAESWRLFEGVRHGPRGSALAAADEVSAWLAAGVGSVGLYRVRADRTGSDAVESRGPVEADGVACHHLHDLVTWPDGRVFGGEFFPLDVPEPPWPDRPCRLWEIEP